jgi:hypothetical protein
LLNTIRKSTVSVAALAALGAGGVAVAGAASTKSKSKPRTAHTRQALSSDVAAKVKQAALDKVPGATVLRTEAGGPNGSAYHAHIKTSDGKLEVVLVNSSFEATAVQADDGPGGRHHGGPDGDHGHGGPGAGETPLTGDTKTSVEDAVKAKYPGATIERTESNGDSAAPYESHITTAGGQELEVLVGKDFQIVTTRSH